MSSFGDPVVISCSIGGVVAGNAVIDDIIDPRETRPTIVKALRMARNKHVEKPANAALSQEGRRGWRRRRQLP